MADGDMTFYNDQKTIRIAKCPDEVEVFTKSDALFIHRSTTLVSSSLINDP